MIFHIANTKDWESAKLSGEYTHPSLHAEGFIHCSSLNQVVETANLYFRGQSDLVLLCIDEDILSAELRYELPANKDAKRKSLFPHLYGPLNVSSVVRAIAFSCQPDGLFDRPQELNELI